MNLTRRDTFARWIDPMHTMWEDIDGNTHISIVDAMKAFELEDTPRNRVAVAEMLAKVIEEKGGSPVVREAPDSPDFYKQKTT